MKFTVALGVFALIGCAFGAPRNPARNHVSNHALYKGADHHGIRGGFKIHRCTKTKEGDFLHCEYNVHYDKLRKPEPITIDHLRCTKREMCDKNITNVDRNQQVTEKFLQHCIEITHSLKTGDKKITGKFIDEYKEKDGTMHKCVMN